eukprot:TRINITY_DN5296_c1_g2_i1.p1 TRINITY_DN5296_c1_g2~~TRINITY_DN5296_c1_g2_i1.p1  ORF type:complete len:285 (-),score=48.81 TRINITY_DN5296_c1_g2_i1:172-1026(-)
MGQTCGTAESEDLIPFHDTGAEIRLVAFALDYDYSPAEQLTSTKDAQVMVGIAERAGVKDITVVTDKNKIGQPMFPTREEVLRHIKEVGKRCQPGDWLVFFWAGHGVNVADRDGDEADGFDEAFVTPTKEGKLSEKAVLLDDDVSKIIDISIPVETQILCICDCCHSGTILDIDSFSYRHNIYQISASQDDEEAEDTGSGGVLTKALKNTIASLTMRHGDGAYSVRTVAENCIKAAHAMTSFQEVSFQYSGTDPSNVAWPMAFKRREMFTKGLQANLKSYDSDV